MTTETNSTLPTDEHVPGANDMAFPVLDRSQTPNETFQLGLTKREYFAAMAMQGVLAASGDIRLAPSWVASEAVNHADELLRELAK